MQRLKLHRCMVLAASPRRLALFCACSTAPFCTLPAREVQDKAVILQRLGRLLCVRLMCVLLQSIQFQFPPLFRPMCPNAARRPQMVG